MSEEIKLLPCPFCGKNPEDVGIHDNPKHGKVYCFNPHCVLYRYEMSPEDWNTRAQSPQPPVEFIQELAMNCKVCGRQLIGNIKIIQCPNGCNQTQPPVEVMQLSNHCSKCGRTDIQLVNTNLTDCNNPIWVCGYCLKPPVEVKDLKKALEEIEQIGWGKSDGEAHAAAVSMQEIAREALDLTEN